LIAARLLFRKGASAVVSSSNEAVEWHRANLKRDRELLEAMLADCGSAEAASSDGLIAQLRNRIGLIEKILAANDSSTS
jgi:hypothetical protein